MRAGLAGLGEEPEPPGADQPTWAEPEQLVAAAVASSCRAGEGIAEPAEPLLLEEPHHLHQVASY